MKAYLVMLTIIDHDEIGEEEIKYVLVNTKYPNWCISPDVKLIEKAEIGKWSDSHPLNNYKTADSEWEKIFPVLRKTKK